MTVDGTTFKGFYFETADNLTMKNVTVTNAGNVGDDNHRYGAAIDINLKYDDFHAINFDNVVVKNSGASSGDPTAAAVVIKTRGIAGDGNDYTRSPATLQSVNITGGSIEDSSHAGLRFESLNNGSGGQPAVTVSGGTQFSNNGQDIVVDNTTVDARGAVFVGAADGFAVEDRVTHALDTTGRGLVTWTDGNVYVTQNSASLQRGVDAVVAGGVVNVAGGAYVQPSTLRINKALTLSGAGEAATTIDARGVNGYGINVTADDVTLRQFTLYGPSADAAASYGIKVAPLGGASARLNNFAINDVTIRGSGRAELDLNGVHSALIDNVTANGAPVGNDAGTTAGAGIQLTDSAYVTVRNSTTLNNAWGGLALYQSNRYYNQQTNMITVGGGNHFNERNPVFMQDESASQDFGPMSISGFDFAVRNTSLTDNAYQYTWLQTFEPQALDFAVNLGAGAATSYVQAWNGAMALQDFHVGIGNLLGGGTQALSVNTAMGQADRGASIRVNAGSYAEDVVANNAYDFYFGGATLHSLTLNAPAGGTGITGAVTADGTAGILFNAPVRLLGDTTLATLGADITLNGDVQNAGATARALRLVAGSGGNRGNVHLATGGSEANALGGFEVVAKDFSLADTLWVKDYAIGASRNVALSGHTLRAQDAGATNTLDAGGNLSGSTINVGGVQITSGGDISANIAGSNVVVQSQGNMNVVVNATGLAALSGSNIVASVVAPVVNVQALGDAQISGSSPSITVNAPSGQVTGNFGQVSNTGSGLVNVNGKPQGNQSFASNAENNRVVPGVLPQYNGQPQGVQVVQMDGAIAVADPMAAGEAIENGQDVELDLSPRNSGQKKESEKKETE